MTPRIMNNHNRRIEILAPAGGFDSIVAAVRSGADAVYVGEKQFSARSSAKNFDEAELKKAVAYCHIHGVKLYVTINTLVFDEEFEQLKHAIIAAAQADADALIVQNMGVAALARQIAPSLALHASTQMSVHTSSGVRALYEMGFKRVVLSREMSKQEIIKAAQILVELEVFVHGALCMSVSGQCYFSAMLGSRSGNRGACAQTCRLPFSLGTSRDDHALSLKDNSLVEYISELEEIGVASAKIEGRMKRPEYVAAAVRACREQRDNGFVNSDTAEMLRGVFSRTGFTDGYYTGRLGKEMFGTRTKGDVVSADEKLLSKIRQAYKDEVQNVCVTASFSAKIGENPVLAVSDGKHTVTETADITCEKALNVPLTAEKCKAQLCKTGGTAYYIDDIKIDIESNLSLPISSLNNLRRNAFARLDSLRATVHNYVINDVEIPKIKPYCGKSQGLRAVVSGTRLGEGFKKCEIVFVPLFSEADEILRLIGESYNVGVEIPRGMFGREAQIQNRLEKLKNLGVKHAMCHNIGALYLAKQLGFTMHGGFGLNIVNTADLLWAESYGLKDVELSFELKFEQINRLGGSIDRGIIRYGHLPLMLCRNCPAKSEGLSCKSCKNQSKLTDRKGKKFYLKCDGCCTEILNCVPVFVSGKEISNLNVNFEIFRFNVENYVENVKEITDFNDFSMLKQKITHGLYKRGVE